MFHSTQKSPVAYYFIYPCMRTCVDLKQHFIQYYCPCTCVCSCVELKAAFHTILLSLYNTVPVPVSEARSEFSTKNLRSNH